MKPESKYAMRSIRHFVVLMTSCILMHHAQICTHLSPKICPAGFRTIIQLCITCVLDLPPPGWKRKNTRITFVGSGIPTKMNLYLPKKSEINGGIRGSKCRGWALMGLASPKPCWSMVVLFPHSNMALYKVAFLQWSVVSRSYTAILYVLNYVCIYIYRYLGGHTMREPGTWNVHDDVHRSFLLAGHRWFVVGVLGEHQQFATILVRLDLCPLRRRTGLQGWNRVAFFRW